MFVAVDEFLSAEFGGEGEFLGIADGDEGLVEVDQVGFGSVALVPRGVGVGEAFVALGDGRASLGVDRPPGGVVGAADLEAFDEESVVVVDVGGAEVEGAGDTLDGPEIFTLIQQSSKASWREMVQVFNMGCRLEMYVPQEVAEAIINLSTQLGIDAKIIGRVESAAKKELTIHAGGEILDFDL